MTEPTAPSIDLAGLRGEAQFDASAVARFWGKVDRRGDDDCWNWTSNYQYQGYGRFTVTRKTIIMNFRSHRYAYQLINGLVPDGLVLDHLCRNRGCYNPAHLEVVTPQENVRRGEGTSAVNSRKTHCLRGHPLSGDNLKLRRDGSRGCKTCLRTVNQAQQNANRRAKTIVKFAALANAESRDEG